MLSKIVQPLLTWYDQGHRILPWRLSKNPYYIWISEIMLQQTRVEAVKPYFERFIHEFPTIEAVANAEEEQLLKMWEGLGYYNRVRNIQKTAKILMAEYDGIIPADYNVLKSFPGIGNYTAGAVSSIAYNVVAPAVDGNVMRVISRIEERTDDIMRQSSKTSVEQALLNVMPQQRAGDFNQALMELGASICVPNGAPICDACPVRNLCGAYVHNRIDELPVKSQKKARKIEYRTVLLIQDGNKVAIHKRDNKGLLAGLYEFPNILEQMSEQEAINYVKKIDLIPLQVSRLEDSKHIFSHIEWRMRGYSIKVASLDSVSYYNNENNELENLIFVDQRETEDHYAIPAAFSAYTKYLNIRLGQEKYRQEE